MDIWIPVIAALGGTVTGGLLTWFVEERRWKREEDRRRARHAEEAAGELMLLLDEGLDLFRNSVRFDDGPEQNVIYPLFRAMRRHAADIRDAHVRDLMEKVATCFYNYHGAQDYGFLPRQTAYIAAEAGRALLGALRRGETPPEVSKLEEIHTAIAEHYQLLAEVQEELRNPSGTERE